MPSNYTVTARFLNRNHPPPEQCSFDVEAEVQDILTELHARGGKPTWLSQGLLTTATDNGYNNAAQLVRRLSEAELPPGVVECYTVEVIRFINSVDLGGIFWKHSTGNFLMLTNSPQRFDGWTDDELIAHIQRQERPYWEQQAKRSALRQRSIAARLKAARAIAAELEVGGRHG